MRISTRVKAKPTRKQAYRRLPLGKSKAADPYNEVATVVFGGPADAPANHSYTALAYQFTVLGSLQNLAENERIARLEVFDMQPSPAGLLALEEAITLTFYRRVDCAEIAAAFMVSWATSLATR